MSEQDIPFTGAARQFVMLMSIQQTVTISKEHKHLSELATINTCYNTCNEGDARLQYQNLTLSMD